MDLTVREAEIVGFLGPNGRQDHDPAQLTTLLRPTAGTATVAGADLLANPLEVRKPIGYVPQAIGETGAAPTRTAWSSRNCWIRPRCTASAPAEARRGTGATAGRAA